MNGTGSHTFTICEPDGNDTAKIEAQYEWWNYPGDHMQPPDVGTELTDWSYIDSTGHIATPPEWLTQKLVEDEFYTSDLEKE